MSTYATLELRATRAAVKRTSNATAVWYAGGLAVGTPVPGIRVVLDRSIEGAAGGMVNDAQPVASIFAPDMPEAKRGDALSITPDPTAMGTPAATDFEVKNARADAAGLLVLDLHALGAL